jgi:hypothetical protein
MAHEKMELLPIHLVLLEAPEAGAIPSSFFSAAAAGNK